MPRPFLFLWRTIPDLEYHFDLLPRLRLTRPCKGEKERGASNIGKLRNKNKHNIPPIIILLPPVSLTFYTASEYISSSSSTVTHHLLHCQHCNAISASPPLQRKPPLPKFDRIAAAVLWPLLIENPVFFLAETISLANR